MRTPILALVLTATGLQAQTTFAPPGATWTYHMSFAFIPSAANNVVTCIGDTIVADRPCSILQTTAPNGCFSFYRYVTVSADSVLLWEPHSASFEPMFILDTEVGGSWQAVLYDTFSQTPSTIDCTVIGVGTQTVSGVTLRVLDMHVVVDGYLDNWSSGRVVERFGDLQYIFPHAFGACDGEINGPLRCYTDAEIDWLNPLVTQCDATMGIGDVASSTVTIVPTVAAAGTPVRVDLSGTHPDAVLRVSDSSGRRVQEERIRSWSSLSLDRPGLYVMQVVDGRSVLATQRIVMY